MMTVRDMRPSDMKRFIELEGDFKWEFGDDLMDVLVLANEDDLPMMFAGAWRRAEVHAVVCSTWGTPGMRLMAFHQLHKAMEMRLAVRKVGRVMTWVYEMKAFCRRISAMGWVKSDMETWTRKVGT